MVDVYKKVSFYALFEVDDQLNKHEISLLRPMNKIICNVLIFSEIQNNAIDATS